MAEPTTRPMVVVTAGPSYEPIDEVRRLTNNSTGELGVMLANRFAQAGWPVVCLLGSGATVRGPWEQGVRVVGFGTNDELLARLQELAQERVAAVLHAAALCDFRVKEISGAESETARAKISSRAGELTLRLTPAVKVISHLRRLFPQSRLVGWKYELEGAPLAVKEKGRRQMRENETDLCVLNGRAYGLGFGLLSPVGELVPVESKAQLSACLAQWLEQQDFTAAE